MDEKEIKKIVALFKEELTKEGLQIIAVSQLQPAYGSQYSPLPPCPPVCKIVGPICSPVIPPPCDPFCKIVGRCHPVIPPICPPVTRIPCSPVGPICPAMYPEYSEFQERVQEFQKEFNEKYKEILNDFNKKYEEVLKEFTLRQDKMIDLSSIEKITKLPDDAFKNVKEIIDRLRKSRKEESA